MQFAQTRSRIRGFGNAELRRYIDWSIFSIVERWPSGLRRTLGKRVYGKPYRGFESHPLRHISLKSIDKFNVFFINPRSDTQPRFAELNAIRDDSWPYRAFQKLGFGAAPRSFLLF